ncbi:VIT domain-containing protein [Desulforhopalus singaporensis]|uniref:Ca-activated chloride channel family protein n=1 Tax=Desulforhopalus singaporensis TaxID=91360 RepID=A0A1H0KN73_9BACT|nr:VIT domain-containing protein [Desulforhopalus singaporensis]SDO57378.1 Ca-activated chloride channel family protein [Desulforhopalus singaporensis]
MDKRNHRCSIFSAAATAIAILVILILFGQSARGAGLLKPKNGKDSDISIKSHKVSVIINNGFAKTEVDQVFVNTRDKDLEAFYTFPVPRQASLSELSLWIDGKEVIGEVLAREKAKQVYEKEKEQGHQTALSEKDQYMSFKVSVYPVKAMAETRVRLVYYQPLTIDLNVGRYVYPLGEGGVDDERIAFWSVDSAVLEEFSFDLLLKSAQPVKDIRLPGYSQLATIEKLQNEKEQAGEQYRAAFTNKNGATLEQDVVFYYRLDDSVPARLELVPYRENNKQPGTFMLTVTPGASLQEITEGTDWVFILDISGSMAGDKIDTLVRGISKALSKMAAADRFRIITFNNSATDLTGGFVDATPDNISRITGRLNSVSAGGGTNLHLGLRQGLARSDRERTTSVVLVTDGVANVGKTDHQSFLSLIKEKDLRLFTFIIGNSANTGLLDKLTRASGGFTMDISPRDDIYGRILQAKNKLFYQALHQAEISFSGGGVKEVTPRVIGSLYRGQQLVLFGKYTRPGPVTINFSAKISGSPKTWLCRTVLPEIATENPELERLWALSAIDQIKDEIDTFGETTDRRQNMENLGVEYSLVTDYTSMVVAHDLTTDGETPLQSNRQRVARERTAQQHKALHGVNNYRADKTENGEMFSGSPSPGVGSGPVSPLMFLVACAGIIFCTARKK